MPKKTKQFGTLAEAIRSAERSSARKRRVRNRQAAEIAARVPGEGYEPCIVSFIDVLGFRHLLETQHAHGIRDVLLHLREFTAPDEADPVRRVKEARLQSRAFVESVSDAVVRVRVFDTQYYDGAFFHELLDLLHAQVDCIAHGVVIRAGVAIGNAHVGLDGKGPVFGPAMVRAYEIETNEAIYPRIVVDSGAYNSFLDDVRLRKQGHLLEQEIRYVNNLLRVDADGRRFIDYLGASEAEFDDSASYIHFLGEHADLVRSKLATTTGRVREKFEWLADYHNSVVSDLINALVRSSRFGEAAIEEFGFNIVELLRTSLVDR